jgi:hypothetical protein
VLLEGMAVRVAGKGDKLLSHLEDVDGDGFMDLVVQIADVDGALAEGATTARLTGALDDGSSLEGTDAICVVP